MSKPRVAILFSGQPRCVEGIAYESFKKCILDNYEVDVYAHFWADTDTGKSAGTTETNIQKFKELYNPKSIKIDRPLTPSEYPIDFIQKHCQTPISHENLMVLPYGNGWAAWIRNCVSMYESMKRVYALFQETTTDRYDWILRTRTDCVLLRCPRLDGLDPRYMYAPNWHGNYNPVVVNHCLILPPDIARVLFSIRGAIESLPGNMDEQFVYNHLKHSNVLDRVRTLSMHVFYPTLTRNGIITDKPEPNLMSEIVNPPFQKFPAPQAEEHRPERRSNLGGNLPGLLGVLRVGN